MKFKEKLPYIEGALTFGCALNLVVNLVEIFVFKNGAPNFSPGDTLKFAVAVHFVALYLATMHSLLIFHWMEFPVSNYRAGAVFGVLATLTVFLTAYMPWFETMHSFVHISVWLIVPPLVSYPLFKKYKELLV